jgi:hypothetical protein
VVAFFGVYVVGKMLFVRDRKRRQRESLMDISYEIDADKRLLIATWGGRHDPLFVQNYVNTLMADKSLVPGLNYLSDQRNLKTTPTSVSIETGVVFLEMLMNKLGPFKYGIVSVKPNTYDLDLMRSLMPHLTGVQVQEFTDMDQALDWLAEEV